MSRTVLVLLVLSGLLTLEVLLVEMRRAPPERVGKVFPELESGDVTEIRLSRPVKAADAAAGVGSREIVLRRTAGSSAWSIVEPIRYPAFHPRVMGIVLELVDMVRVAEVPRDANVFPDGPVLSVGMRTRLGNDVTIELGIDHPDATLSFCYARVGADVFVTRKQVREIFTVSLEELMSRALVPVSLPDAVSVTVADPARGTKRLERVDDTAGWRLREPIDAMADRATVETLVRDLNAWSVARFEKDDAAGAESLAPFGLAPPGFSLEVRSRDGSVVTLEVGKELEVGGTRLVYLRRSGEPFVVSAESGTILDRLLESAEEYRARFLFDTGVEEISEVTLEGAGKRLRLRRLPAGRDSADRKDRWEVGDPAGGETYAGDSDVIGTMVAGIQAWPIEKFVGPEVAPSEVGLDPPLATLVARTSGGRQFEVRLGVPATDGAWAGMGVVHAAVPGEPGSYLVASEYRKQLDEGPLLFRQKRISEVDFTEVLEWQVVDGPDRWFLGRLPGEGWTLSVETPVRPGQQLDESLADKVLRQLDRREFAVLRYLPEVDDYAAVGLELSSPRRAILLTEPRDLPGFRRLVVGVELPGSEGQVCARVDAAGVPPFTIAAAGVPEALDKLVRHLREITGK